MAHTNSAAPNIVTKKSLIAAILLATFAGASCAQAVAPSTMEGTDHTHMDHAAHMAAMAKAQRQTDVSERGKDVMPFSLSATLHIFTKSAQGGVQQVVARNKSDAEQTGLVRQHLKEIQGQFLKGDFSGPSHIHGAEMPGLAELEAAKPGLIAVAYKEIPGGAQLTYATADPSLVAAIHKWFDAQVSDHGKDAMAGR